MNFLAHALLARGDDEWIVGSLIADFRPHSPELSKGIWYGIELHRRVDSYADKSEHFQLIKEALRPAAGLYAPVVADICCDNLLISQWERYCRRPLRTFTADIYESLEIGREHLPHYWRGPREDWLASYRHRDGLELAMERVKRRVSKTRRFPDIAATFDLYESKKNTLIEPFVLLFDGLTEEAESIKADFEG